jgi:hypothetical protein
MKPTIHYWLGWVTGVLGCGLGEYFGGYLRHLWELAK